MEFDELENRLMLIESNLSSINEKLEKNPNQITLADMTIISDETLDVIMKTMDNLINLRKDCKIPKKNSTFFG